MQTGDKSIPSIFSEVDILAIMVPLGATFVDQHIPAGLPDE